LLGKVPERIWNLSIRSDSWPIGRKEASAHIPRRSCADGGPRPVAARSAHPKTGRLLDFIIIGIPIGIDAAVAAGHIEILARVAAQTGEPDRAIAILEKALSMLGLGWNIPIPLRPALLHLIRCSIRSGTIRAFQKLAADIAAKMPDK